VLLVEEPEVLQETAAVVDLRGVMHATSSMTGDTRRRT
jgi:hypothetical protein